MPNKLAKVCSAELAYDFLSRHAPTAKDHSGWRRPWEMAWSGTEPRKLRRKTLPSERPQPWKVPDMKFLDSVPGDRSRVKKKRQKMKIIIITAKMPASRRWRFKRLELFLLLW
jgi:hypothetical protein